MLSEPAFDPCQFRLAPFDVVPLRRSEAVELSGELFHKCPEAPTPKAGSSGVGNGTWH